MGIAKYPGRDVKSIVCNIRASAKAIIIIIVDAEVEPVFTAGSQLFEGIPEQFVRNPFHYHGIAGK